MSRWRADLDHPTRADVEPAFTMFQAMPIPYVEPNGGGFNGPGRRARRTGRRLPARRRGPRAGDIRPPSRGIPQRQYGLMSSIDLACAGLGQNVPTYEGL
jgi:hypothetical protein